MKFNGKKIGALTVAMTMAAPVVFAAGSTAVKSGLADWVSLVAEILSFVCLTVFAIYTGRFVTSSKNGSEASEKVADGVRNGIMTCLVGIGICQAVVIVAQTLFIK